MNAYRHDRLQSTRVYHAIPAEGEGLSGVNYDEIRCGYDAMARLNALTTPGGTIFRAVFDVRNNPVQVFVGTDDTGASDADPTGGGAAGNNMVLVAEYQYDGGQCGGAGNLTQQTLHVDAETVRATAYGYDWRNRRTTVDGEEDFFQAVTYDNLNRPVTVARYDTTASGNLVARTDTAFDDLGRVYQKLVYAVDPATGILGDALADNTWYDLAGNPVKRQPAGSQGFTKTFYDGAGRPTGTFLGYDPGETSWEQAGEVDDDTIVEQTETVFDAAGNAIFNTTLRRMETSAGTGPLQPPAASQPWGRAAYQAAYFDGIGRRVATADYGTAAPSLLPGAGEAGGTVPRPAPRCWSPRRPTTPAASGSRRPTRPAASARPSSTTPVASWPRSRTW